MNIPSHTSRRFALTNALSSISKDRRFPKKVLAGHWEDYLFFDTVGTMFDPSFIEVKNLLLAEEKASVIALLNLGNTIPINYDDPPTIFIEQNTEAKEYIYDLDSRISEIDSKGHPFGWRIVMDRYVCASDTGNWSIYCEKQNNMAVFAWREGFPTSICSQVETLLRAKSIKFASPTGDSPLFDFIDLRPDWRFTLVSEHAPSDV